MAKIKAVVLSKESGKISFIFRYFADFLVRCLISGRSLETGTDKYPAQSEVLTSFDFAHVPALLVQALQQRLFLAGLQNKLGGKAVVKSQCTR